MWTLASGERSSPALPKPACLRLSRTGAAAAHAAIVGGFRSPANEHAEQTGGHDTRVDPW
jgi:hypothetical protein